MHNKRDHDSTRFRLFTTGLLVRADDGYVFGRAVLCGGRILYEEDTFKTRVLGSTIHEGPINNVCANCGQVHHQEL